jgi:hypothetical protein
MVVNFDRPSSLVVSVIFVNFTLCFVHSNALCLFQSCNRLFFSRVRALYGHCMKLFEDANFIINSMNVWFLCTFH